jgi:hypothetical protein
VTGPLNKIFIKNQLTILHIGILEITKNRLFISTQ